jgi:hypothetical protein
MSSTSILRWKFGELVGDQEWEVKGGGVTQVAKCPPGKHKALSLNPNTSQGWWVAHTYNPTWEADTQRIAV